MKKGVFIVFLLVCVLNVNGKDVNGQEGRLQELEKRIEGLEMRILILEKTISGLLSSEKVGQVSESKPIGKPWEDITVWRKLKRGMSKQEVTRLLGEAHRIDVYSTFEEWHYDMGGHISFDSGKVSSWREPLYLE